MIASILIILICLLLILVVLVQNSKGGGIQSQFGAATQIMGVKQGTEFIEKATWGLAIALIVTCIFLAPKGNTIAATEGSESSVKKTAAGAVNVPTQSAPAQQAPQQPANGLPSN
jgi:preprotein translocase subunit SecG